MSKRHRATLRKINMPHVAPGCVCFEADCRYSTSGITQVPGPLTLPDEHVILAVGYLHEERCGRCDVADVLAKGDPQLRRVVDDEWPKIQGAIISHLRRN